MKSSTGKVFLNRMGALLVGLSLMVGWIDLTHAKHKPEEEAREAAEEEKQADPAPLVSDYVSPLKKFKKYTVINKPEWIESNKTVGEIGGWRVYAKEAFEEEISEETEESDESGDKTGEKE